MQHVSIEPRAGARLGLAALLLTGCTTDLAPSPLDDQHVELPAEAQVLAALTVSDTHAIKFYDLGDGHTVVVEAMNIDHDGAPLLTAELMQQHSLPEVYRHLAGDAVDAGTLHHLQRFEKSRPVYAVDAPAGAEPEVATRIPVLPQAPAADALVEKAASDDAYFFSGHWCNSCMGIEGQRISWMPSDRPVCTTTPEACVTGAASYRTSMRSNSLQIAGYNQNNTGTGSIRMWLNDPCENDSWWSRKFSVCTKGSSLLNFTMQPRTAYGMFTSQSGSSWSRSIEWTAPSLVGFMYNRY